jgi:hypothetical protein
MLKNLVQIIKTAVVCVVAIGFHCVCYAGITEMEVSVGCNRDKNIVLERTSYGGSPDTQLSLVTKGMQIAGVEELVVNWDNFKSQEKMDLPDPGVRAECVPYDANGEQLFDVYGLSYESMWPPHAALVCKKGEGISIAMYTPNNEDPNKYRYVATLIINKDEKKRNIVVEKIYINSPGQLRANWYGQKINQLFNGNMFNSFK